MTNPATRPPLRRPPRLTVFLWVLAGVVLVAGAGWWFLLRDDAPQRASLPDRPSGVALPASTPEAASGADLDGTWQVRPGPDVFVGYRATEQWAAERFEKTAVGRSPAVTGTMRVHGQAIETADLRVDLTRLGSDQSARDAILRGQWLETDQYPEARFRLSGPLELPGAPKEGEVVEVVAVGDLTVHGRTREVHVPLEARWNGTTIDVAGGTQVDLRSFDVNPPDTPFISVAGTVDVELQLTFTPVAGT